MWLLLYFLLLRQLKRKRFVEYSFGCLRLKAVARNALSTGGLEAVQGSCGKTQDAYACFCLFLHWDSTPTLYPRASYAVACDPT